MATLRGHAGSARWRRASGLSPEAGVERGLAILAVVWQGLWILPNPGLWPGRRGGVIDDLLLGAAVVNWCIIVVTTWGPWASRTHRFRAQCVNLVVLYAGATALLLTWPVEDPGGWRDGASLLNLAVGLTGLLLVTRIAMPVIALAVIGEAMVLVALDLTRLVALSRSSEVLYPLYALAIGAATIGGRRALMLSARRAERAQADLATAQAQSLALRQVQRQLLQQARLLHETVLNTLTALARGGLDEAAGSGERIRTRCRESAMVLDALAAPEAGTARPTRDWARDLESALSPLTDAGMVTDFDVHGEVVVPDEVYVAVITATREALSNIQRHARASHVEISVGVASEDGRITVSITDDGVGFDPRSLTTRFGLAQAIHGPMLEVGGTAQVESIPGDGAVVRLTWAPARESRRTPPMSTTAFVIPVLSAFGLFILASVVFTLPQFESPGIAILAFAGAAATGIALAWRSRSGALPAWLVIVVCLVAPLVYTLQQMGLGSGPEGPWTDWSSEAIVALLLVVAAAGPWWGWIAALVSWLFTQGDVIGELVHPGTAILIAGGLFARSVRADATAFADIMRQREVELASVISEEEGIRRTGERYAVLRESAARGLLEDIAEGHLDPLDESVRERCAREERFIRAVMRLDPAADPLHAVGARLAVAAHRRGIPIDIDVPDTAGLDPAVLAAFEGVANRALRVAIGAEPARLSARREGEVVVVRFVISVPRAAQSSVLTAADPRVVVAFDPADPVMMLEVRGG